ncbi:MAG: hypothetical protein E7623_06330 [Ruminococcaceae bacterium]|nr:hypothetical protein [Oscillospiraceae bacterium]
MKKLLIFALVAVMLLCSACSDKEGAAPMGMKALSDEKDEYYLYIPEDWNIDTSMGIDAAYCQDTTYGNDFANISFIGFSGYTNNEDFWKDNLTGISETYKDIAFEIEAEQTLIGEQAALRYVYTASVAGVKYKFMQAAIYNGGYVYLFTYTALEEYYDDHYGDSSKDINMILDNLEFK